MSNRHSINATVAGYAIVLTLIVLNAVAGCKAGVACALAALAATHVAESFRFVGRRPSMAWGFVTLCGPVASFVFWLYT